MAAADQGWPTQQAAREVMQTKLPNDDSQSVTASCISVRVIRIDCLFSRWFLAIILFYKRLLTAVGDANNAALL
jgi:hypothetical protein